MTTTRAQIGGWFDDAPEGATHMIIVCDTFDYSDYPAYFVSADDARTELDAIRQDNFRRAMEVYDLRKSKAEQIAADRVWNI
jgi:hypothetical protein